MKKYDVAAYIWPAFTGNEKRAAQFWEKGMGEWQTVMEADAKFEGHNWPRKPLWGYCNEADPRIMEMQIDVAASYGVNVFIYDWYWFDGMPFLENCLNDGYLKARNNDKVKFYLMWANHDVTYGWDKRNSDENNSVIWRGDISREGFEKAAIRLIKNYFSQPNYYKIDGAPVFMFYDIANFIKGMGGFDEARDALEWFRAETVKNGHKSLHLQFEKWGDNVDMSATGVDSKKTVSSKAIAETLRFDSFTNYHFVHLFDCDKSYPELFDDIKTEYSKAATDYKIPYCPHVSIGWDNNPRFKKLRRPIITENTPKNFETALRIAKEYLDVHPKQPQLVTINSWNEWTEGSYLIPDDLNGYGYLEAVKKVFKE